MDSKRLNLQSADLELLKAKGISPGQVEQQLEKFETGFPYLKIIAPATVGNGIIALSDEECKNAILTWQNFLDNGGTVSKFVPASGAASRMFKSLFTFVEDGPEHPAEGSDVAILLAKIHEVAFYDDLNDACVKEYGEDVDSLLAQGREKEVVKAIIKVPGLNYGSMPKGLLLFHRYKNGEAHTPVEEHLIEGAQTARQADGKVNLFLTVSPEHRKLFESKLSEKVPEIEKQAGVRFTIDLSEQEPRTDTIAVNEDNTLFRDEDGNLVFRPGGHGALIRNLDRVKSDVVFVKNIDNVVPNNLRGDTLEYKRILGGFLIELQQRVDGYVKMIDSRKYSEEQLNEVVGFLKKYFCFNAKELETLKGEDLSTYLRVKLNRPIRVCGMVKNEGEPGGGPYIVYNSDNSSSLQILESSQIDLSKDEYKKMMDGATHFNPVDLVCYIKDAYGHHFNLPEYVDPQTGFISSKSFHGKTLKALELPGLWNGSMSDWLTAFIEVPISTFNPVKVVNDLLRPQHQGD